MDNTYLFHGNAAVGGALERLAANAGWQRVDSLADADVVVTYCTNQQALEDAYFDEGGFVQTARSGTLMIDLSPSTPGFARELSAVALVSELHPVEAPIAVLDPTWEDAFSRPDNLICFVAGEEDDVAAAKPFLQAIAGEVLEEGPLGSAQLARAARTVQQVGTLVATAQACGMTVGHSAPAPGVNPAAKSGRVSYPIAGRGLSCLGSPAAPGKAVSNVLPVTFSRQFRHKKTPCASTAQGVFS